MLTLPIKKKVYESWAFTENESEKARINREIYNELKKKYKIYRHDSKINLIDGVDIDFKDFDVVIGRKACYHHGEYKVYKNDPNLSIDELALICDGGNLCFGYRYQGDNNFYVFED
jgi:hypothetical protein